MKAYKLIEFRESNEINIIGIYTSELAIWLYLENLNVYSYEYLDKNYNTILIRVMEV